MKPALLLVDIQLDYFPKGRMTVDGAVEASLQAKKLLAFFREKMLPIVHIQHIAVRPNATFLLPNTKGIEFYETVMPASGEKVIEKHYPNSFRETGLQEYLASQQISDLVICGMMSQMCIDTTTRAAFDKGYSCTVAHDACAARSLSFGGNAIPAAQVHGAYMAALGAVFAKVLSTEEIMAAMESAQ